jgi:hypothetical protein
MVDPATTTTQTPKRRSVRLAEHPPTTNHGVPTFEERLIKQQLNQLKQWVNAAPVEEDNSSDDETYSPSHQQPSDDSENESDSELLEVKFGTKDITNRDVNLEKEKPA